MMGKAPEFFTDLNSLDAKMTEFILQSKNYDIDYALVMQVESGWNFHYRLDQPCYGELRKYAMTHGTLCTRPESEKPDDLYYPFPEGVPYAIAVPFYSNNISNSRDNYLRALVSADSPWISGFGSPSSVTLIENPKRQDHITGFILRDMHVDPTVMVHLIWATCYVKTTDDFDQLLKDGFSVNEALAILVMNCNFSPYKIISEQDNYHWGSRLSLKRFLGKQPRDFSGGMFDNGYDYNRRMIQDIFYSETGLLWKESVLENLGAKITWGNFSINDGRTKDYTNQIVGAIRKALDDGLKNEEDIVEKPFPTEAPVMNPGGKFFISTGWGNRETGEDYTEDEEDEEDYYDDDYDPDCTCEYCQQIAANN